MKAFTKLFSSLFSVEPIVLHEKEKVRRDWDRARSRAMTPSERSEIDAIFSRHL